jgi:hypothetical protein
MLVGAAVPLHRRLARWLLTASGWLAHIHTPQRMYGSEDGAPLEYVGRRWTQCVASVRLLELAEEMDAEHFDHWALIHDGCDGWLCLKCGGWVDQDMTARAHAMVN